MALKKAATATPARMRPVAVRSPVTVRPRAKAPATAAPAPANAASGTRSGRRSPQGKSACHRRTRPCERRERHEVHADEGAARRERDGKGRAQVRPRRRPEQVGVGQRVAKDTLVGRAGGGQHATDQRTEDDARKAQRPQDRGLSRIDAAHAAAKPWDMRKKRGEYGAQPYVHRTHERTDRSSDEE